MKPIEWDVLRGMTTGTPPRAGAVVVQPYRKGILRFSAAAGCRQETELFLALVASFCASEGIRKDTGVISWVRWPSSVAIDGRNVATASARVLKDKRPRLAVLDFSVNVAGEVDKGDISLLDAVGVEVDRKILLEKILESLAWMHAGWSGGMHPQVLRRVKSMTESLGSVVKVSRDGKMLSGTISDIDARGRLLVDFGDGSPIVVGRAGEVSSL